MTRSPILTYSLPVVSVLIIWGIKILLNPISPGENYPFLGFLAAIMLSAWYGGTIPGIISTILSVFITDYFWLIPKYQMIFDNSNLTAVIIFVMEGLLISIWAQKMQKNKRLADMNFLVIMRQQQSLTQSQTKLNLLLEGVIDYALIMLDEEGKVISWNLGVQKLYFYEEEEILGDYFGCFFTPEDIKVCQPVEKLKIATEKGKFIAENWQIRKDGTKFFAREIITALKDENNLLQGFAKLTQDITERKNTELLLQENQKNLEIMVQKRTEELEAVNKELEAFSYSVSHDLRAPVRHISGFVELLQKRLGKNLDEISLRYLNNISQTAKHAGNLVDDLLEFSRMGRTEMRCMLIDMKQLVQQVQKERELDIKDRNIIWEIGDLPKIYGDGGLLKLVVHNLISNAIKYTRPREEAKIIIDYETNKQEIIYFIKDNGVGFDYRYVDKLFGVFQRLHSNKEFEGTGIGLANVKRIIQRHGGKTWAEGTIDQGATFYFALPNIVKNQEKCINDPNFIS